MADEQTPAWMKQLLGAPATPESGSTPDTSAKKPGEVFLKHGSRDDLLPPGTPPRQQSDRTHEGLPAPAAEAAPSAIESLGGVSPRSTSDQQAPRIPGMSDPRIESWMNKDPNTWYPKESQEWTRWRKQLTNPELVNWEKMRMETARWHQFTRQPGGLASAMRDPAYSDYRKRYDEFMKSTVPRWRKYEQSNPPRHYRRRADLEALGGNEFEVAQT